MANTGTDNGLWVSVLGSLVVSRNGVELEVGTGMRRAVLGLLALHPNTWQHREVIIDTLWGDAPPATAVNQVQAHVSQLRKILDPDRSSRVSASPLESLGTSYMLRTTSEQLDLLSSRDLTERADAAARRNDLHTACDLYEAACSFWRGNPLAEMDLLRDHPAVIRLAEGQATLIIEYAKSAFKVGQHDRVLPSLRALIDREPLNEQAHAQLMVGLAETGQQAAALEVFGVLRHRLDDQLGILPSADVSEVHERVLRQDLRRSPDLPASDGTPSPAADLSEQVYADLPAGVRQPVCQLPPALTDFVGRTAEIAGLIRLLTPVPDRIGVPVAVISGLPGVGKTALALQVAHRLRHEFPDGQLHVELTGSAPLQRDPADVLGELLRALGLHGLAIPDSAAERAGLFRSHIAGQRLLVMADDVQSVDQVRPLLPGTTGCAVIVTSRSRLGGLAGANLQHLDPLPHSDAVEMLSRIIGRSRVAAEVEASDKLVATCGRLPLAVRIAGAKLATRPNWSIVRTVDAVADHRRRLDELALDDLAFRASVMPSYQALDEPTRRAFRRLGLIWPTDIAEWVIAALLGRSDASDIVNQLVDKSLLMPVGTDATGEPRYRLHDLLRDFAIEQLDGENEHERAAALERTLMGWLEIAAAADHRLPRVPAIPRRAIPDPEVVSPDTVTRLAANPVTWFTAERLNLMESVKHACANGLHEFAGQLASRQAAFQYFQARVDEAEQLWHLVIAATKSASDSAATAYAELHLVQFMTERGRNAEALVILQRSGSVFDKLHDQEAMALVLQWRAYCAEEQGLLQQAREDAQQGIELAKVVGDRHCELSCLRILGQTTTRLGNHAAGLAAGAKAVALARELREPYAEYETLHTLANANNVASRFTAAADLCLQAMDTVRNLQYEVGKAYVLGSLGDAYNGLGRYHEAIDALSRAQQIFKASGILRGRALCSLKIAHAYEATGDYEQAAHCLETALPVFRKLRLDTYEQRAVRALKGCTDRVRGQSSGDRRRPP